MNDLRPDASDVEEKIRAQKVVPILRTATTEDAIATARVCADEGMDVVELTTSTPDVVSAVDRLVQEGLTVGVGTVRSMEELSDIARAGARYAVSYFRPPGFIETCLDLGLEPLPGVITPGEMQGSVHEGARILKIFPAWQSHPRIIADMAPLLGDVCFLPTAGMTPEMIVQWLAAGAVAVGTGRALGTVGTVGEETVRTNARNTLDLALTGDAGT